MHAGAMVVGGAAAALLLFGLLGGPLLLGDWFRERRRQAVARQIAVTDALDGQLGAIVAPVVRKPLFGPWEIQIAVPFHRSATVARILAVVDEVFPDIEGAGARPYRIFLTAKPGALRETRPPRTPRSAEGWPASPLPPPDTPARLGGLAAAHAGASGVSVAQPATRRGGDSHGHA